MELQPIPPAETFEASALREQAGRVPPHATDVERAVLGALLLGPESFGEATTRLRPSDFYDLRHERVFAAMVDMVAEGSPVDLVTLSDALKARGEYDGIGGYYLTELATSAANPANVAYHAQIVREKAMLREAILLTTKAAGKAYDPGTDPFDLLDELREGQDAIIGALPGRAFVSMQQALDRADAREDVQGAPSRLGGLREILGGWKPGKLYVAAGRPGMGKSSHAKGEALRVASVPEGQGGGTVAVFTLEMGVDEYAERMRDEAEGFWLRDHPYRLLGGAQQSAEQWEGIGHLPVELDDSARLATADIRAKLHRLANEIRSAKRPALRLVIVDYLQLLQGRGDTREQEVASIARDLKIIAREFEVAVLALAQLSRACEQRMDKRPILSDLRESGEIEQAADVVLFYYRAEVYGATEVEVDGYMHHASGAAEVIVGKHRGGPTGTVHARFHGPTTSFRDFDEDAPHRPPTLPF